MVTSSKVSSRSWLAFDLNVLRRLNFSSAAIPLTDEPRLGSYLKHWNVRVAANDPLQSAWARATARIANRSVRLSDDDVATVLEDAYVPGYRLHNPGLTTFFNETDSWWFDNVRRNIDRLPSINAKAVASTVIFGVGDYALSFREDTRELRQPLSIVFRRLLSLEPAPVDNGQDNSCLNRTADDFIAETPADLMFLRLPAAYAQTVRNHLGRAAWREEWIRGGADFWEDFGTSLRGRLGAPTETKSQYLHHLDETLRRAAHIKTWAIAHVETGFIQTNDIAETVRNIRRVDAIYTKDFSELTGTKAIIITA